MKKLIASILISMSCVASAAEFTVMHGPGGVSDIVTRFLSREMSEKNYNVVNRPGAAGKIAIRHLMNEKTIMLATMPQVFVTNPLNYPTDLGYNPTTDLEVIATVGIMPSVLLCNTKTELATFSDIQKNTKTLTFGVGGYGSSEHVATEVLINKLKVKHVVVPYAQGGSTAINDLLGGHISCMFANFPTVRGHLDHPNLKVLISSHNVGLNVPTWESEYKEAFPFQAYLSVVASSSMDVKEKRKVVEDLNIAFQKQNYNSTLQGLGVFPRSSISPADIQQSLRNNDTIRRFITENKIRISQ